MSFDASRFLENLTGAYAAPYFAALHDLLVSKITGNRHAAFDAMKAFSKVTAETMGVAEVLGARLVLREAAPVLKNAENFAAHFSTQTIIPSVTLDEAIENMISRTPVTIRNAAERTAQRIAELYSQDNVVVFARSAEATVTKKAQDFIASALREGLPSGEAGRALAMSINEIRKRSAEWTEAYARQVFRTNVNTAVTAGRFRQVQDQDIKAAIPAFRFDSVGDSDTRHNHDAADGMILTVDNPAWNRLAPPLGYNSFVPGTRVAGHVDAASKAFYTGAVVTIKTRKGGRLTVTPNHPVLTASAGFQPAGSLTKGQHLIRHEPTVERLVSRTGDRTFSDVARFRRAIHDQDVPPRIEDVFYTARSDRTATSVRESARPLALDFHGDACFYQGDVDVVSVDVLLPDHVRNAAPTKVREQLLLAGAPGTAGDAAHRARSATAAHGGPLLLGAAPELDASLTETVVDDVARGFDVLRQLEDGFAGEISLDEIVSVDISSYAGHVYDLQSPFGTIVANGLFASNCRCQVSLVTVFDLEQMGRIDANGNVRESRVPFNAAPDDGFRHGGRPDLFFVGR